MSLMLATTVFMAACHSNPYSDVQGHLDDKPPQPKPTPINNFYVQLDSSAIDVLEGATAQVKVTGVVPKGKPILRYENLPAFVTVDSTGQVLNVAPGFGAANDPKHPGEGAAVYSVDIYLTSTDNPASSIPPTTLNIVVHNVARGITVANFDSSARIDEGSNYMSTFDIQSPDFPQGPFTIAATDLPAGLKISPTSSPTRFQISYNPPFSTVKTTNRTGYCAGRMCMSLQWRLTVVDPRGFATSQNAFWSIVDVRQNPIVVTPTNITALFPNADFYVTVEDPNGETIPQVTATVPSGTTVLTTSASSSATATNNPYVMTHTTWTGSPASTKGTTQTLTLRSCVNSDVSVMNQCVTTPVNVQF